MATRLGPSWLNRVQQLAGPTHAGRLGRYAVLVDRVNALEPAMEACSDDELKARAPRGSPDARQGDSLNSLLVEAFAMVREAAKRTIGQRHFDVQLVGGIAIHNRCIAEMETGEGKTLVATMPAFLNALPGKGVHVVTVNDYLARRDAEWMAPIYKMLGLTVGCIQTGQTDGGPAGRLRLRHHLRHGQGVGLRLPPRRAEAAQDGRGCASQDVRASLPGPGRALRTRRSPCSGRTIFAIVDEADSILIDEARTPLIIGANNQPTQEEAAAYYGADQLAATLVRVKDFKYDPMERKAELTAAGPPEGPGRRRRIRRSSR